MLRQGLLVAVLLAAALGLLVPVAAQQPTQQLPVFRSDAHFVTVDAYPLRDGKVVEGLTAADFTVEEDGQPQAIENFEFITGTEVPAEAARRDPNTVRESMLIAADARTRAFVVYLDVPHVSIEGARATRGPLVTMLNALIGENDLFAVTTPNQPPHTMAFARKLVSAEGMLTRHWAWGTRNSLVRTPAEQEIEQCFPADNQGREGWIRDGSSMRPAADVIIDRAREEQTLQHLEDFVIYLGQIREGRTSVILFTEGWRLFNDDGGLMGLTGRQRPPVCDQYLVRYANINLQSRFREIMARANRSNVTFYPVNPAGLATFDVPISQRLMGTGNIGDSVLRQNSENISNRSSSMQTLAENTDGLAVVNTNDLKAGLLRVSDQLKAYYLLGYYSSNRKFDGKARRISVKVKQPGIDVKARRGYTAPTEAERSARSAAASAPAGPTGPSPVEAALDALSRIRPSSELFVHATLGAGPTGKLTVVAEVSGPQLERGALQRGGTLDVTVTGAGGAELAKGQVGVMATSRGGVVVMDVPPGTTQANVSVMLRAVPLTFLARTDVTRDTGAVIGGPLIYRATPSSRSPLLPVAGFDFRRTERVHVDWPITGPLDRREARLLGRNGQPIAVNITLTEREVDGRLMLGLDALLAPLAPGDYVIEVTATIGTTTETRLVGIRVGS
ncbi:MAG: VWA domain-containing protein [Acidobacteria bacterium]|nr:VWA domain-containing protein [Acidobacteriota bacterium]